MTDTNKSVSGVSYTKAGAGYFEKRSLRRSAGFWGLWGIGIAAVISGDFSGWNSGIGTSGWGALAIATVLIAVMYFALIFSIGEMSSAQPHTGGAYSFARSALGPWGGFVTGLAETVEYVVTTAVVVWFSAIYADSAIAGLLGVDSVLPQWLWWIILYIVFIGLNSLGASIGFRFALIVALISIAVILFFVVTAIASGSVDFGKLLNIAGPDGATGQVLPFGAIGILFALPFAIWFFLGIEELPLAAEEAHNPQKDIPRAGVWGIVTLVVLGLLVLVLNPAVTGSADLAVAPDSGEPLLGGFRAILGTQLASLLAIFALIGLLASLQGIMFAYGRNMYSLSRAGYYPKVLSLTSARFKTPVVALVVGGVIGFIILLLVLIVLPLVNEDAAVAASGIILLIAVFGAVISYIMQMVSFIVLRRKFPNAARPYKSPVGIPGAVVAGILAFAAFLGIVLNSTFLTAVITFVVIFVVGIALFALVGRHSLVLSPEEEYALSGGMHGDPQSEGYDAMEGEVFGGKAAPAAMKAAPKKK
jgi:ethanolamine permease